MATTTVGLAVPYDIGSYLQSVEDQNQNVSALGISTSAVQVTGVFQTSSPTLGGNVVGGVTPVGSIVAWAGPKTAGETSLPPVGWLFCDGTSYLQSDYPQLFSVIGDAWGGDATNFNVPDLRGCFLRGVDEGTGVDLEANSRSASYQQPDPPLEPGNVGDAVGSYEPDQLGPGVFTVQYSSSGTNLPFNQLQFGYSMNYVMGGNILQDAGTVQHLVLNQATQAAGGETTVKNKYVYYIIFAGVSL